MIGHRYQHRLDIRPGEDFAEVVVSLNAVVAGLAELVSVEPVAAVARTLAAILAHTERVMEALAGSPARIAGARLWMRERVSPTPGKRSVAASAESLASRLRRPGCKESR